MMPLYLRPRIVLVWTLAAALLSGCGKKGRDAPAADSVAAEEGAAGAAAAESPVPASQPTSDPATAPLAVADIERWEKGMAAELKAVREGAGKMKAARNANDTLSALTGLQEMATIPVGARAAGMDENRYKVIRSNLSAAVSYLAPPQLGGLDTTMLSPAQRDELRKMNQARLEQMKEDVPSSVVEALRPRAAELKKKELELALARVKGAGM